MAYPRLYLCRIVSGSADPLIAIRAQRRGDRFTTRHFLRLTLQVGPADPCLVATGPCAGELALRPPQFAAGDAYYAGIESARPATGGWETNGNMAGTSLERSRGPYQDFEAR